MATTPYLSGYSKVLTKDSASTRSSVSALRPFESDEVPLVRLDRAHGDSSTEKDIAKSSTLAWWLPEIIASILSAACFASIIGVLRGFEGRALAEMNLPYHISLNGIIAALATLNRAFLVAPVCSALMQEVWLLYAAEARKPAPASRLVDLETFDQASRGAWGSIKFFFRFRRPKILAHIAALVIIVSLGFGTFAQQLVSFDSLVPVSSNSALLPRNLPRSESWAAVHGTPSADSAYPPYELLAAIYNGALGGGVAPVQASCPSGNCTWPLTPSLAISGGCVNTTFTQHCYDACAEYPTPSPGCKKQPSLACNYTLASGSKASLYNFTYTTEDMWPGFQVVSGNGGHFNRSTKDRMYVANFDMIGAPYITNPVDYPNASDFSKHVRVAAWECAMWMSVQTYNTTVVSTTQEQTVASVIDTVASPNTFRVPNTTADFQVSGTAVKAMVDYFDESFSGVAYFNRKTAKLSSDLIAGIWNGTQTPSAPQQWIENVATSMSNVIRTTNSTSRPEYDGTASQLGVTVRWAWLTLPAVLVASSMFILAAAIVRTARSPVQAWRGSPLTLLLIDVDERIRAVGVGQMEAHKGVERAVGGTRVRLFRQQGRAWSLKAS